MSKKKKKDVCPSLWDKMRERFGFLRGLKIALDFNIYLNTYNHTKSFTMFTSKIY